MHTRNIKNRSKCITVRRLNNPCHFNAQSDNRGFCIADLRVISENAEPCGIASLEECHQLVSPSFIPYLETALPLKNFNPSAASFGGAWFWEGYRHALYGEDIIYDLSGTGNSLMEDSIDSQKELRKEVMLQKGLTDTSSNQQPMTTDRIGLHSSAKLEIMYAIALSIALHVSQQPLLDQGEGPHALILCAAKYQCDEMTFILNQFCAELHLVVHNLFEPFPSMPSSQRADIVVGTAPLWDSVAELGKAWDRKGLEGIISNIYGGSPPPTYTLSKWRPYTIRNVSQLALFDLGLQINAGFGRMLVQILSPCNSNAAPVSELPLHCQTYSVLGGDRAVYDVDLNFMLFEILRSRGKRNKEKISEISLQSSIYFTSQIKKRPRLEKNTVQSSFSSRKILTSGLLIKNAVSFSRLLVDRNAFQDFVDGILDKATLFWDSFDVLQTVETEKDSVTVMNKRSDLHSYVKCVLVFVCTTDLETGLRVKEMCTLLIPENKGKYKNDMATVKLSRFSLLFRHLEEQLNGELFDGSVVSCVNLEDSLFRNYHYEFVANEDYTLDRVDLYQGYFSVLSMAQLLLATYVVDKDDEYLKETSSVDFFRNNSWLLSRSNTEATFDMSKSLGNVLVCIPNYACITPVHVRHTFTVVALRNLAESIKALCYSQASINNEGDGHVCKKPFALFLLEECCQYGRVISYYCFEQNEVDHENDTCSMAPTSKQYEQIAEDNLKNSFIETGVREPKASIVKQTTPSATTATLFIEFESHESALEAVRLLRVRFHSCTTEKNSENFMSPRVHLFRNTTYYAGVEQDLTHKNQLLAGLHEESSGNDMLDFSLLAE
ncbi:unnamed protein product [Phytomonas sp. Hart1]|nr:unnamed protein product [Phytomonas sp. Hart1]|eukprot:CCW71224.1 unnamed protein product [Phytomonas sp. isolate Hart1]